MKKKYLLVVFIVLILISCSLPECLASFDEYYNKWKEEKGIETEVPYQNLTDEQKAKKAQEMVDEYYEEYNKDAEIEKLNKELDNNFYEIEQLKDDKKALHFIYWSVIICMGLAIWNLKKEDK